MIILGITHPISWNNAACLLVDGRLIAMGEEERFNRIKHSPRMFPKLSIDYCLKTAGITMRDVDYVAVGFDKALKTAVGILGSDNLFTDLNQAATWIIEGKKYEKLISFDGFKKNNIIFVNHHLAHAAGAYYPSGFDQSNFISLDGSGGTESGSLGFAEGTNIQILKHISNRGSWGLLYELVTAKLGFRRHSDEGKVMGLAAYGLPDPGGLPCVDWSGEIPVIDPEKRKSFIESIPTRHKDDEITDYHKNLAATLQDTLERAAINMARWLYEQTGVRKLVLSGGTALNCSMNGKLAQLPFVDEIFIQPAAHDAGTALGAAIEVYVEKTGKKPDWIMDHAYWGPEYSNDEIESALKAFHDITYKKTDDICRDTAKLLTDGKIVGWFQGRLEIGPRALGNRSILADPTKADAKDRMNNQVKHREPWRPFAPSLLAEETLRYFAVPVKSPFMILAYDVLEDKTNEIPAAIHIDNTARPQTVTECTNPRYYKLIKEFKELSGVPVVLNTSFNVDKQPIVNTPYEAIDTFINCGMDALAIGDYLVIKSF